MEELQHIIPHAQNKSKVHLSVTLAVAVSLVLIMAGIWNAYKTGLIAEENIKASLQLQRLSDSIRFHQESMTGAIEFALTTGEAHWHTSYETSLLNLQDVMHATDMTLANNIVKKIQLEQGKVIEIERKIFSLVTNKHQDKAFSLFASDQYQEIKIEQEQDALTLRASLDRKAKDIIVTLKSRLDRTTIALAIQIVIIVAIWLYIITIVRRWQIHQSKHSEELTRLAHYDALTGIGNRALFHLRLETAFQQSRRDGKAVALVLLDIDHFKDINDNLGHDVGDSLLIKVAEELQKTCRESDTVVRLGGDEFAIIATNIDKKRDCAILGNKILSIFEHPLSIQKHEIKTGTSIGLAFFPDDADTADELLRKADMALYEAKRNGRAIFKFFDKAIEIAARNKAQMQTDLQIALDKGQFTIHYQPIVDIAENIIIGVESLIRWEHPEKGNISPDEFIPIAEESRQIVQIGEWVLRTACQQQVDWERKNIASINMAVNLSAVQFNQRGLLPQVEKIMQETGIREDQLTVEITESTLMETGGDVIAKLHALKSLGLKLAIDDFGTGYSSLAYLKRFPIHHLKIDREFVKDLPENTQDIAIARSIIKMAHELQIKVVAEGIESQAQLRFLKDASCNFGQGFHFGKPMPAAQFEEWLGHYNQQNISNVRSIR
ncbi:EAL domain-containing protein [Pseudomonadales bacterium]|nr:EAL domain-containing protein [Pseudomonadales bacterium]